MAATVGQEIRIADFGDRVEAYDRLPHRRGVRRLALAQKAGPGDDWQGWRVWAAPAGAPTLRTTKRAARQLVELLADRALAEAGPEFYTAQLARLAEAVRRRDGAAVLKVLEYLAAEGDAQIAAGVAAQLRAEGLVAS